MILEEGGSRDELSRRIWVDKSYTARARAKLENNGYGKVMTMNSRCYEKKLYICR